MPQLLMRANGEERMTDIKVLALPLLTRTLRNYHHASSQVPCEDDLIRGSAVLLGEFDYDRIAANGVVA